MSMVLLVCPAEGKSLDVNVLSTCFQAPSTPPTFSCNAFWPSHLMTCLAVCYPGENNYILQHFIRLCSQSNYLFPKEYFTKKWHQFFSSFLIAYTFQGHPLLCSQILSLYFDKYLKVGLLFSSQSAFLFIFAEQRGLWLMTELNKAWSFHCLVHGHTIIWTFPADL